MKNNENRMNISADDLGEIITAIDESLAPKILDSDGKVLSFDSIEQNVLSLTHVIERVFVDKHESVFFLDNMAKIIHDETNGSVCETIGFKHYDAIMSRVSIPLPMAFTSRLRRGIVGMLRAADKVTLALPDECDSELLLSAQILNAIQTEREDNE